MALNVLLAAAFDGGLRPAVVGAFIAPCGARVCHVVSVGVDAVDDLRVVAMVDHVEAGACSAAAVCELALALGTV